MPGLLDMLDSAARAGSTLRFPALDANSHPFSDIWERSRSAGAWLQEHSAAGSVATVLTPHPDCLSVLFGAWRSGIRISSLPNPARGVSIDEYKDQILSMVDLVGADRLLVSEEYLPLIPELPIPEHGFGEARVAGAKSVDEPGQFVQFTSGATTRPKGVRLDLDAIAANVDSILTHLQVRPGDGACSWLPLSHDMGLIGMTLSGIIAAGSSYVDGPVLTVLLPPEQFVRTPSVWLKTMAEFRSSITAVPNFALDLASRFLSRSNPGDLSCVRVIICGGEQISADSLRRFTTEGKPFGLCDEALAPAYGLAEASLAVSMIRPDDVWASARIEAEGLENGEWRPTPDGDVEVVSTGPTIPQMQVRVVSDQGTQAGEIQVRGPSMLTDYVGADLRWEDGWLPTRDLGYLDDDHLFVMGRTDDVVIVRGRNLFAWDLERRAAVHPAVRPGNCAVVADGRGQYAVIAEVSAQGSQDLEGACDEIRSSLASRFGAAPSSVVFVSRGALPKTPSGKVRRNVLGRLYLEGDLPVRSARTYAN